MSSGVNKAIVVGRLGADPEIKYTQSGQPVCALSVATSESWKDKGGKQQERTEWHRVKAWGKLGELCGEYLQKGRQVYVEGKLQTSKWQDKAGADRYTTEIVASVVQFLDSKREASQQAHTGGTPFEGRGQSHGASTQPNFEASPRREYARVEGIAEEDIPF